MLRAGPPQVLLEHTRSTRREGIAVLSVSTTTMAGFVVFAVLAGLPSPSFDHLGPVLLYLFLTFIYLASLWYGCVNVHANSVFRCYLDHRLISCSGAVRQCGDDFCVNLDDIDHVQRVDWDDSYQWYLITKDGRRFSVTRNYRNPASRFIDLLVQARPSIRVERK